MYRIGLNPLQVLTVISHKNCLDRKITKKGRLTDSLCHLGSPSSQFVKVMDSLLTQLRPLSAVERMPIQVATWVSDSSTERVSKRG